MTTTTANMGLSVPTLNGQPGTWDTDLNASLALIDLHDHSTGKGVLVPTAGLNINANLTFANNSATNLKGTVFTAQATAPATLAAYVKGVDLYYKDGNSNEIRLTASGAINIATTGGFTGDYIAAAAAAYYDDANKTYRFVEAAPLPNDWSYVACGGVDLYERASGILTRVRLSSPAALAASYEVTWPAALPAATLLTQVSAAGVMTWSNTISEAVIMSSTLAVTGTATVTGLITASAGLTAAANQHVTVSGTGEYKHGAKVRNVSPFTVFQWLAAGGGLEATAAGNYVQTVVVGPRSFSIPLPMDVGERITDLNYTIGGNGGATADFAIEVAHYTAANVRTVLGSATKNNEPNAIATYAMAIADTTMAAGDTVIYEVTITEVGGRQGPISFTYTRP